MATLSYESAPSQVSPHEVMRHVAAIAALCAVVALRWRHYLIWPIFLGDEDIYIKAFEAAAAGQSPYDIFGYFYPASLSYFGGWLVTVFGEAPVRYLMRTSVDLGLVTTVWFSLSVWRAGYFVRLGVAAAYLVLAPTVHGGLENGNLSFAVIGVIILALFVWPWRPVLAGLLLGASVAAKQLAPLIIAAILFHRPVPARRQHWIAGAVAGVVAVVLLLPDLQYDMMSAASVDSLSNIRTVSVARIFALLGFEVSPFLIAAVVAVVMLAVCRLRPMTQLELMSVATTAAVLSLPVVWSHTLLLTLPIQVQAIVRAFERVGASAEARASRYESSLVLLMVAAIQLSVGREAAIGGQPAAVQVVLLLVPVLAPSILTLYLLRTGRSSDD